VQETALTVTSSLQTSAGRMIFGRVAASAHHTPEEKQHVTQRSG